MNIRLAELVPEGGGSPQLLIDELKHMHGFRHDAELADALAMNPETVSKIRCARMPIGPSFILRIHEVFRVPVADIRRVSGTTRPVH